MIIGIQIIGTLFALFMLYYSYVHFQRQEFTIREFVFWALLWVVFMVITLFPEVLSPITRSLEVGRTMDLLIIGGFMVLLFMFVYTYSLLRRMQAKLEDAVQRMARKK